uniref:Uncharacterized protein n=1 Tax=Arundo donax TaxID=35708 RepID=A0A0A9G0V2_ARUDO
MRALASPPSAGPGAGGSVRSSRVSEPE